MSFWRSAAVGGAVALAFGAGLYLARPAAPAQAPVAAPMAGGGRIVVERPGAGPVGVGVRGPSLDEIRAAVREELAQRGVAAGAAGAAGAADDASADHAERPDRPGRAEEVRAAVAKASAAVSEGIRRGVWSDRERAELRTQLAQLGPAEIHEVLGPLFQAINSQQLHLDGPPI